MAIDPKGTNILIALPVYGQMVTVPFVVSLMALSQRLASAGINHAIKFMGDSLIPRLRNNYASLFLAESEFTHMLFLDVDLEFTPDAILHMLDMEKPVIGCVYTRKSINWENVGKAAREWVGTDKPSGEKFTDRDLPEIAGSMVCTIDQPGEYGWGEPIPVPMLGTGLMLIRREVFEQMRLALPDLEYKLAENEPGYEDRKIAWDFFGCFKDPDTGFLLSEDYAFCKRALGLGFQPWILTCHRTVHHGIHGFVFNMQSLQSSGVIPSEMKQSFCEKS